MHSPSGAAHYHLRRRKENPQRIDLRLQKALTSLGLKYEWPYLFYVPTGYSPTQWKRKQAGEDVGKPTGIWMLNAARVDFPFGGYGLIQFWGNWTRNSREKFRNPNARQKRNAQEQLDYCIEQKIPLLLLERHYDEPAVFLYVKRWIIRVRGGDVAPYRPILRTSHTKRNDWRWEVHTEK